MHKRPLAVTARLCSALIGSRRSGAGQHAGWRDAPILFAAAAATSAAATAFAQPEPPKANCPGAELEFSQKLNAEDHQPDPALHGLMYVCDL